jgi:hypothetical protein
MGKSNENYTSALEKYHEAQERYTGEAGYKNALNTAKGTTAELTAQQAQGATSAAQDAARKAGYTKAQAAAIGAGRGADSYINNYAGNLATQQGQASGANESALSAKAGEVSTAQAQDQAEYDRGWGTAGNVLSAAGNAAGAIGQIVGGISSDERSKIASTISGVGSAMAGLGKSMQGKKEDKSFGDSLAKVTDAYKAYQQRQAEKKPEEVVKEKSKSFNDTVSDKRAKIYEEASPYKQYANLNAYLYKYKPELVKTAKGRLGMDDKAHVGVMAQELEKNPVTAGAVHDDNGIKTVDTRQLTMANTATLADIAKEIEKLKAQSKGA